MGLILNLFILILIFYLVYRLCCSLGFFPPTLFYNHTGKLSGLIKQIYSNPNSSFHKYLPTFWLINRHLHTIQGMQYRKRSRITPTRELLVFEDGGTAALDWFEPSGNEKDDLSLPVVVIIPTLAGGSREPVSNNLAATFARKNYRAVIVNNRCCAGAPITSGRFYNALFYQDLDKVIKHIRSKFTPSYLFLVGSSLGGYQAIEYAIHIGDIDGLATISHTYQAVKANALLSNFPQRKLYLPIMMSKLKHIWKKNPYLEEYTDVAKAKTLDEFDAALTIKYEKMESVEDYYTKMICYPKLEKLKVPTLMLGSNDDPFTLEELQPREIVQKTDNVCLLVTREGGHVSFLTGLKGQDSYVDKIIPEWFENIQKWKKSN